MTPKHQAKNSFRKAERLSSHTALDQLYTTGEAMLVYPIRCVYRTVEPTAEPLKVMIAVPKRNHRRAVHRNLLKRRIRESYRLNRSILKDKLSQKTIEFSLTYIAKEILEYQTIENAVKKILAQLGDRLASGTD